MEKRNNKRIIEITRGDEFRAKIETELKSGTLFSSVYRRAGKLVQEIISESKNFEKRKSGHKYFGESATRGYGNNVIMFYAGRGEGKTSAMHSFSGYLSGQVKGEKLFSGDTDITKKYKFDVIEAIDPSMMAKKDSIIKVLLSRLFYQFNKKLQETNKNSSEGEAFFYGRNKILQMFSRCYKDISFFAENREWDYGEDNLENLAGIGSRMRLRDHLNELVQAYLAFGSKEKEDYLIVQIDDADLFEGNVYEVYEDIRSYLAIPPVIVLMACNMEQLKMSLDKKYYKEYSELKKWEENALSAYASVDRKCEMMTIKYLEKVFPEDRRIRLPGFYLSSRFSTHPCVMVLSDMERTEKQVSLYTNPEEGHICEDMYEQLLRLLYEKTVMIFAKTEEANLVFPQTFRELIQMMKLLLDMEDVDAYLLTQEILSRETGKTELEKLRKNLKRFRCFFIDYWCKIHLDEREREIVNQIYLHPEKIPHLLLDSRGERNVQDEGKQPEFNIGEILEYCHKGMERKELCDAIIVQYTLVLHKRFLEGIIYGRKMEELTGLLVPYVYERKLLNEKSHFEIDRGILDNLVANSELNNVRVIDFFCSEYIIQDRQRYIFDLWNPFVYVLRHIHEADRIGVMPSGSDGEKNENSEIAWHKILLDISLIMLNPVVWKCFESELNLKLRQLGDGRSWSDWFYGSLDAYNLWGDSAEKEENEDDSADWNRQWLFLNITMASFELKKWIEFTQDKTLEWLFLASKDEIKKYVNQSMDDFEGIVDNILLEIPFDGNSKTLTIKESERLQKWEESLRADSELFEISDSTAEGRGIDVLIRIREIVAELLKQIGEMSSSGYVKQKEADWMEGHIRELNRKIDNYIFLLEQKETTFEYMSVSAFYRMNKLLEKIKQIYEQADIHYKSPEDEREILSQKDDTE